MNYERLILLLIASYLIGSIPFGYILGRIFTKKDLRQMGSGSTGTTNVLRNAGFLPAISTLILDISKGIVAFLIALEYADKILPPAATYFFIEVFISETVEMAGFAIALLAGFVAIVGHCYPIWLNFKGGKGFASTLGIIGVFNPEILQIALSTWLVFFLVTRYVSLGSIMTLIAIPTYAYYIGTDKNLIIMLSLYSVFGILVHGKNITRLLQGKESKTVFFKKNKFNDTEN